MSGPRPRDRYGRPLPPGSPDLLGAGEPDEIAGSIGELIERAIGLFDRERFFEAHELFEHLWNSGEIAEAERGFWKAATQVAVGCCHVQRGNAKGAAALLERAAAGLGASRPPRGLADTPALIEAARDLARRVLERGATRRIGFFRWPRS